MPSVRGVRFDPNREGLAGLCNCCMLTEAHPLEQIPGWQNVSHDRTKMSKVEKRRRRGGSGDSATLWLGTWSSLSLQLTGAIGFGTSQHSLPYSLSHFYFNVICLLSSFFIPPRTHNTQSVFHSVIHAVHLQCFQERQIKSGFSYHSVTLEQRASWITINSIKLLSFCFSPSPATTQGAWPCHC